ncbi:hypothetical protein JTB14_007356 [Gonioctena quinquepunctata]|nr:hypothetical protein JTB14_007356 [Gonioctena quinquepunctata]
MQISLVPAYKCPYCKALAHKEIENEQAAIFCVYCDIPMEKIIFKEEHKELKQAKSDCFEDCLNENIDCGNIEENYTEYVIFTDSDDDGQCESLKELYVKFSKSSLEEIVKSDSFPSQDDQLE